MSTENVTARLQVGVTEVVDASGNTLLVVDGPNRKVMLPSGTAFEADGLDTTEMGLLDGATAGTITASKVVTRTSASGIPQITASPAAAGTDQTNGVAITADYNTVTGADGTKGAVLPVPAAGTVITIVNTVTTAGLKVYPGGASVQINALTASTGAFTIGAGKSAVFVGRSATQWYCEDLAAVTATTTELNYVDVTTAGTAQASKALVVDANKAVDALRTAQLLIGVSGSEVDKTNVVIGVAGAYKIARGETALDGSNPTSVAHGLTTCVSFVATLKGTAAPGASTSVLTANINGANVDVYAWKPSGAALTELVASTGTESFYWVAVGV